MARKQTSIDVQGFETTFIIQKRSSLQPVLSGSGYYTRRVHLRGTTPFANRFIGSFDSQVNPTILPGAIIDNNQSTPTPIEIDYILSESNDILITEDNNNLIIE